MRPSVLVQALRRDVVALCCMVACICFAIATPSAAQTFTTLVNFNGSNGQSPRGMTLIQGADGNFYGTTAGGGANGGGTVFKMTPSGTLTTLYSFNSNGNGGANVLGGVVQGADGNFYGATFSGGTNGMGTIFKLTPQGVLTTLHNFSGSEGANPYGPLVQGSDGNFYGTTNFGGLNYGVFFKITPTGTLTKLYSFCSLPNCADGGYPHTLALGTDGNFYSTTYLGGANGNGSVFQITPTGVLTTLHSFAGPDGNSPQDTVFQASDGNFWGTTSAGGSANNGVVFKVTPRGTYTVVYSFCSNNSCLPGAVPFGSVIQGIDGNFYGMTTAGGAHGAGAIYALTPQGMATSLYSFCSGSNCSDGSAPAGNLLQASNNIFYGATDQGGTHSEGTIFSLALAPLFSLTVSVAGSGSVTSSDGFINCPGTCMHAYQPNTQVTLNASPAQGWSFSGWTGACTGVGSCVVTMTQNLAVTAVFVEPGHGFQFANVTPCRLVDTRQGQPIQGGTSRSFTVPALGGCNIPASALAYSLNVTVVPHGALGYLTIWPTGEAQPYVSTMNSYDGRIKANAAIVPAGTNGAVSVYVSNTSDVVLDIDGYFIMPGANTLQFYPLTPCRVVDTRNPSLPQGLGPPAFMANETRRLPVLTSSCLAGVSNAKTYSMNMTVVPNPPGPVGFLTVWPSDQQQPYVSTLNDFTGTVVANAAIVPAAANGDISVFVTNGTDVVVDINGYFAPPGQGGSSFYPAAPCRVFDSRNNNGPPFSGERTVLVSESPCASPQNAQGYIFNATVVPANGPMWYLTLWPDHNPPLPQPTVSTLNSFDGAVTSNMAIVPNLDGSLDSYAATLTQLIMDISGYFAP